MSAPTGGSTARSQFALPRELDAGGRRELAGAFAEQVCGGERLPYTLALHRGGQDGGNPHAHLMFSERGNDGIARSAEQWFQASTTPRPRRRAGRARAGRPRPGTGWTRPARRGSRRRIGRWSRRAGPSGSTGRSIADRRDAAHHEGDLERAAELSREPKRPPRPGAVSG